MTAPLRMLVVDDLPEICELYRVALRRLAVPHELVTETDARRALERVRDEPFHLIVSDFRMPQVDGLQVLAAARAAHPRGYRVLMTGYNEVPASREEVAAADVDAYIQKPIHIHDLVLMVRAFLTEERPLLREWREEARETEALGFGAAPAGGPL